jgi:hypothetical protein
MPLTAWVGEAVAPLVLALSELDGVIAVGICQGGRERAAYVRFRHRDGDDAGLVKRIASLLSAHAGNIEYVLRTVTRPDGQAAELTCGPGNVLPLALAIRASIGRRPERAVPAPGRDASAFLARPDIVVRARRGALGGRSATRHERSARHLRLVSGA